MPVTTRVLKMSESYIWQRDIASQLGEEGSINKCRDNWQGYEKLVLQRVGAGDGERIT